MGNVSDQSYLHRARHRDMIWINLSASRQRGEVIVNRDQIIIVIERALVDKWLSLMAAAAEGETKEGLELGARH